MAVNRNENNSMNFIGRIFINFTVLFWRIKIVPMMMMRYRSRIAEIKYQ